MAIGNEVGDFSEALRNTKANLVRTAKNIGNLLAVH
jgi:hypothetical protein